jgi:hypothetical protein
MAVFLWHSRSWCELVRRHALACHTLKTHIIDRLGSSAAGPLIAHNMGSLVTNKSWSQQVDKGGHGATSTFAAATP